MSPDTCPICGILVDNTYDLVCAEGLPTKHICNPQTLKAIDQAHKKDGDQIQGHSLNERLTDGFKLLKEDE